MMRAASATDESPLSASNKVGVELSSVALTGTTGTSGKITLSLLTASGSARLYVENRTGALARLEIVLTGC